MPALDTNVLVRWLTNDDAAQCARVEAALVAARSSGQPLYVPLTVLLEVEWVLRSRYRFDRATITAALDALLGAPELDLQDEPAVERALWWFKQAGAPDFADCLHVGVAAQSGREPLLTLDARASKLSGARLLA